jgi:hypothetical protein
VNDEQDSTQSHSDPPPTVPPVLAEPGSAPPREPASAQQLADVEKQMTGFEKATVRWAKAAVLMSGLAAVFVCLQWREMHTGGADTHSLAIAAKNQATWTQNLATNMQTQADRTKDLADRMKDQADRTKTIADQAVIQAQAAQVTAGAAKRSADAARSAAEEAELSQRPWIKGSARETGIGCISRGFLECDEFGSRSCRSLRFQ